MYIAVASLWRSERPSAEVPGVMSTPFLKNSAAALKSRCFERAHTAQLVRQSALERQIELPPEWIGHEDLGVLPELEMLLGFRRVSEAAVRHRER